MQCDSRTDVYQDRRAYVWEGQRRRHRHSRNDRSRFVDDASWGRDRRDGDNHRSGGHRHWEVPRV